MTKTLRIFIFFSIGLILMLMFLPGVLVPMFISSQIKSRTGYVMDFGNVDIRLFRGFIQLKDVKLQNNKDFPISDFIHLNELKIDLDPLSLFQQKIVIEDAILNIKNIAFVENQNKDNNLEVFIHKLKESFGGASASSNQEKPQSDQKPVAKNTKAEKAPEAPAKKSFVIKHLLIEVHSLTALMSKGPKDLVRADSNWTISEEYTDISQDNLNTVTLPLTSELTKRGISLLGQILIKKTVDIKGLGEGIKNVGTSTLKGLGGFVQGIAETLTPEDHAHQSETKTQPDSENP